MDPPRLAAVVLQKPVFLRPVRALPDGAQAVGAKYSYMTV
jgi:hypothetical protein